MKLALAALFLSVPALASPVPNGHFTDGVSQLEINGDHITLDKDHFEIGKESITEAYAVGVSAFMGGDSTECRATSIRALRTSAGDLILLRFMRSKTSHTAGLACGLSRDVSKFSEPYGVEQIVLHAAGDGSLTGTDLSFTDGLDRPRIDLATWSDPEVLATHPQWKEYLDGGRRNGSLGSVKLSPVK